MKKVLFVLIIVLVVIALLFGCSFGIGIGKGDGKGEGESGSDENVEQNVDENKDPEQVSDIEKTDDRILRITVSGNGYIFDNQEVSFDDIKEALRKENDEVLVEITDSKASKNAYDDLIKLLDELGLKYFEMGG